MNKIHTYLKLFFFVTFLVSGSGLWASEERRENQQQHALGTLAAAANAASNIIPKRLRNALAAFPVGFFGGSLTVTALGAAPAAVPAGFVGGGLASYYQYNRTADQEQMAQIERKVDGVSQQVQGVAAQATRIEGKVDNLSQQVSEIQPYVESTAAAVGRIESNQATESIKAEERHRNINDRFNEIERRMFSLEKNTNKNTKGIKQLKFKITTMDIKLSNAIAAHGTVMAEMHSDIKDIKEAVMGRNAQHKSILTLQFSGQPAMPIPTYGKLMRPLLKSHTRNQQLSMDSNSRNLFQ